MIVRYRNIGGFSLVELSLALAVSAVIISAVSMAFQVTLRSNKANFEQKELLQHARFAMNKMVTDLRYAAKIINVLETDEIEFLTRTRLNDDWQAEKIRYFRPAAELYLLQRSIENGTPSSIAGVSSTGIRVDTFIAKCKKLDGSYDLVDVTVSTDSVVAVEITLVMKDSLNHEVRLLDTVRIRNN